MVIVDTSVWIRVLKDKTGKAGRAFRKKTSSDIIVFSHFVQLFWWIRRLRSLIHPTILPTLYKSVVCSV